eukprot:UN34550
MTSEATYRKQSLVLNPGYYKVILNTIVRQEHALDSPKNCTLKKGVVVYVAKVRGRRVRLNKPVHGWCSTVSSRGDILLEPLGDIKEFDIVTGGGEESPQRQPRQQQHPRKRDDRIVHLNEQHDPNDTQEFEEPEKRTVESNYKKKRT